MTKKPKSTPRYQALAKELLARIESGTYALGSQFPTEFEICAEHQVSRHTVRAALARLHALGLIERRPGLGTRVTAPSPPLRYQQDVCEIEDLLQFGCSTRLELQLCERVVVSPEVAEALLMQLGSEVIRVLSLRVGEDQQNPVCTADIYVRPARGTPSAALLNPVTALPTALKFLDFSRMDFVDQTFDAVPMPGREARLLDVAENSPALRAIRVYHALGGRILCCIISLHPSGRFAYSMRLARGKTA